MLFAKGNNYELLLGDCVTLMDTLAINSVDMIFADPPYKLSNGGITCKSGQIACVDKGKWDKSQGFRNDYEFNKQWLKACDRVLKPNGTIWISGTYHIIHSIAFALMEMDYYIINEISWFKPNAPPNMGCRCFTASHEILLWAKKNKKAKHIFNYQLIKELNGGKQMRSVWEIPSTPKSEKRFGYHPTQKPIKLLDRCILSSSNPGDLILDPFCGSGTTGISAINNHRIFLGIEIEKEFCELSRIRLQNETVINYNINSLY
ncbi:MAG TPA: site-specific DNA-methyltransferase [Pseudobacteroides sp.]|nr:site-specific DNA-methyltransferase [Pseudobacteroides sp.]